METIKKQSETEEVKARSVVKRDNSVAYKLYTSSCCHQQIEKERYMNNLVNSRRGICPLCKRLPHPSLVLKFFTIPPPKSLILKEKAPGTTCCNCGENGQQYVQLDCMHWVCEECIIRMKKGIIANPFLYYDNNTKLTCKHCQKEARVSTSLNYNII